MIIETYDLVLDPAKFPMVWVEGLDAYIHLLPVTKIQYEYYLWDTPNSGLDQGWYDLVTKDNKRISPQAVTKDNYWQLFMTAILPSEAEQFSQWASSQSGDASYSLPTKDQWQTAYRKLKETRESDLPPERKLFRTALEMEGLAPRCRTILDKLADLPSPASLAERLLLLGGVMEWVIDGERRWGLFGYPFQGFASLGHHPDNQKPLSPTKPEDPQARHKAFGFRLLRKKVK
jgi:formylglycine-generating enzyme required for sulfatase activity